MKIQTTFKALVDWHREAPESMAQFIQFIDEAGNAPEGLREAVCEHLMKMLALQKTLDIALEKIGDFTVNGEFNGLDQPGTLDDDDSDVLDDEEMNIH